MRHTTVFEEWYPITHDYGVIRCSLEELCGAYEKWIADIGIHEHKKTYAPDLSTALKGLLPLTIGLNKALFIQTHSDWITVLQNGIDGSDPQTIVGYLSTVLKKTGMRFCSTPVGATYPATIWEVYAPEEAGGEPPLYYRRSIGAANDGGSWTFDTFGDPYDFEVLERYTARLKRKRFTHEHLVEYAAHFGVVPFSDEFLRVDADHPAVMYEKCGMYSQIMLKFRTYSLEEVKAGKPWSRS